MRTNLLVCQDLLPIGLQFKKIQFVDFRPVSKSMGVAGLVVGTYCGCGPCLRDLPKVPFVVVVVVAVVVMVIVVVGDGTVACSVALLCGCCLYARSYPVTPR